MVSFPHEKVLISTDALRMHDYLPPPFPSIDNVDLLNLSQVRDCALSWMECNSFYQLSSYKCSSSRWYLFFDLHVSHTFLNPSKPQAGKAFFVSFQNLVLCWVVPPTLPLRVTWGGIAISLPFFPLFQRTVITSTASTSTTSFPENSCPFSGRDINAFFVFIFDSRR